MIQSYIQNHQRLLVLVLYVVVAALVYWAECKHNQRKSRYWVATEGPKPEVGDYQLLPVVATDHKREVKVMALGENGIFVIDAADDCVAQTWAFLCGLLWPLFAFYHGGVWFVKGFTEADKEPVEGVVL